MKAEHIGHFVTSDKSSVLLRKLDEINVKLNGIPMHIIGNLRNSKTKNHKCLVISAFI